ncbi:MAG TPA: IS200/IS605 family transposase [Gemmatimonadales bacterium]|nr:IS200/IS605 family transposase [Gemmatimonadales bacterium]
MRSAQSHKASGLYAHLTWHTWRRQPSITASDVPLISSAIHQASSFRRVRVHALSVLSDHVHVLVSYSPAVSLAPFIRHAKSESSRRLNLTGHSGLLFQWARGYYAGSLSRSHIDLARVYLARQHAHHPGLIPK